MDFSSDANFEGLLEVNREICMPQMAEKTSSDAPPNCALAPYIFRPSSASSRATRSYSACHSGLGVSVFTSYT